MNSIEVFLYTLLVILIFVVIGLTVVFLLIKKKEKEKSNAQDENQIIGDSVTNKKGVSSSKIAKEYDTKSVFDFMEFDTVKDNMIVQKGGRKFLMAIECKGVNYDLMSEIEKTATEQGFSAFLNTIREPIQIYIQTRTINLEKNILSYKERVEKLRDDINLKEYRLKEYAERPGINEKILKDKQFELLRQKNLYSYGADIVTDTQKMSLNKSILKKKYYIIIKYYYEPSDVNDSVEITGDEIREIAFSNLYTKALSLISVLSGIGVIGRALNSFELVELLYNAYNRDDSEVFGIDKAIEAGYDEIYVDSERILDKRLVALNKEIQMRAQSAAQNAIDKVMDERSQELKEIEDNLDNIIEDLAKKIIESEGRNIPEEIRNSAIEKIEKRGRKKKGVEGSNDTKESNSKRRAS